jgi:hypothetical protein
MTRLATSFVLGYHGCKREIGERVLNGRDQLNKSEKDYDWLGSGVYFWESDPRRALEWAQKYKEPYVIGAVIELGNCLDLTNREDLDILKVAYEGWVKFLRADGREIPKNQDVKNDTHGDKLLRKLDCAVVNYLHKICQDPSQNTLKLEPYDTVRGLFPESKELYSGSGFKEKTHTQIAVCNMKSVKGFFIPRPYPKLK